MPGDNGNRRSPSGSLGSRLFDGVSLRASAHAARLQALDHGAPVSLYTVARDGDALVRRVYGHLGDVRHRLKAIECRIEQHARRYGIHERLDALRATKN